MSSMCSAFCGVTNGPRAPASASDTGRQAVVSVVGSAMRTIASVTNIVTISAPIHVRMSSGSFGWVSAPISRWTRLVSLRKSAKATATSTIAPHRSWLTV